MLEDGSEHGLNDNGRAWVRDERRLLMQLLGEEVDSQVAVLTGSRRGADTDDLARTTLQDQEVTETDVVRRDGDGVGSRGARSCRASGSRGFGVDRDVDILMMM